MWYVESHWMFNHAKYTWVELSSRYYVLNLLVISFWNSYPYTPLASMYTPVEIRGHMVLLVNTGMPVEARQEYAISRRWKVKTLWASPQPYQPYEAEITNSPCSPIFNTTCTAPSGNLNIFFGTRRCIVCLEAKWTGLDHDVSWRSPARQ